MFLNFSSWGPVSKHCFPRFIVIFLYFPALLYNSLLFFTLRGWIPCISKVSQNQHICVDKIPSWRAPSLVSTGVQLLCGGRNALVSWFPFCWVSVPLAGSGHCISHSPGIGQAGGVLTSWLQKLCVSENTFVFPWGARGLFWLGSGVLGLRPLGPHCSVSFGPQPCVGDLWHRDAAVKVLLGLCHLQSSEEYSFSLMKFQCLSFLATHERNLRKERRPVLSAPKQGSEPTLLT